MGCSDIATWYLERRLPVIDLTSKTWARVREEILPPGYEPSVCLRRLMDARRVRRLIRGVYQVIDPVRDTPAIAIADALFADVEHYVTTDAALVFHRALDQPLTEIVVVAAGSRRPIRVGTARVRRVVLRTEAFLAADAYMTSVDGFRVTVAAREQAIVDALGEPSWMTHLTLLPEVLAALDDDALRRVADGALRRSTSAAQRLGFLLDEAQRPAPAELARLRPRSTVRLDPRLKSGSFSTRWRVYG
jgi:predicted transcriptional regulator of viral defense system